MQIANIDSQLDMADGIRMKVHPESVLVDEGVHICVEGLPSLYDVTLVAVVKEKDMEFISHAHYRSDSKGHIDLSQQPCYGGSYKGIEPMGFVFSLKPSAAGRPDLRLVQTDIGQPQVVDLYVLQGHVTITMSDNISASGHLARTSIQRYYKAPGVKQFPVRDGNIRGILFIPDGEGPFPAVIDMFGGDGGLKTFRAALLASRGFLTFSLAYFRYEDLPSYNHVRYEYLEEAVDWLSSHPLTLKDSGGIGAVGVSYGALLAMIMSILSHQVKAVVSLNGHCARLNGLHTYRDTEIPTIGPSKEYSLEDFKKTEEGFILSEMYIPTPEYLPHIIQLEKAAEDCEFLFVAGEDDLSVDISHTYHLVERLHNHGRSNYRLLCYPGAGHLIDPPHAPTCRSCHTLLIGTRALYGGETKQHARAQEDSWREILAFLHQRLNPKSTGAKVKSDLTSKL